MTWPTDDLTKVHLDAGTDSPSSARAELEALMDKVKLILGEATPGDTLYTSTTMGTEPGGFDFKLGFNDQVTRGNSGDSLALVKDVGNKLIINYDGQFTGGTQVSTSLNVIGAVTSTLPLDANLLNTQDGAFYRNANNLNNGIVPLARLSGITSAQLASNAVGQSEISSGAVHQGELDTGQGEVSTTINNTNITLAGGEYGFYPNVKLSGFNTCAIKIADSFSGVSYVCNVNIQCDALATGYVNQRYINSSPPHKIKNLDYRDFIFIKISNSGDIISTWIATDPPWYHNGPTRVTPNIKKGKGKKFRRDRVIPENLKEIRKSNPEKYYKDLLEIPYTDFEITSEFKNSDMGVIPHPFASAQPSDNIIIIEPNQDGDYMTVCDLFSDGESICELLHEGNLIVDQTQIPTDGKPPGVPMHRIKWKNTRR